MTVDYTKPYQPQGTGTLPPPTARHYGCLKGALIGCGIVILIGAIGIAGLLVFVFTAIKSSSVYREAMRRAQANPQVIARLGTPIENGWWVTGTVHINGRSGTASISFPIHGPKAGGTIHADATEENGNWTYEKLVMEGAGPPINLMQ